MRRLFVLPPVLVVLLCGFLAVSEEQRTEVTIDAIRMGVNAEGQTRLVLDLDRRPDFIAGPVQKGRPEFLVYVDGGRFVLTPDGLGDLDGKGVIDNVAFGPGVVRLNLEAPALATRSFILAPAGEIEHFRLVVDLDPVPAEQFAEAAKQFREPAPKPEPESEPEPETEPVAQSSVTPEGARVERLARLVPPPSLKPRPQTTADVLTELANTDFEMPELPPEPSEPLVRARPMIVLDPGHGGHDPGSVGQTGAEEEDVVLAFSKTLAAQLRARGYDVLLTRNDDSYVLHQDRIGLAREQGADLFMSIHADSLEDRGVRGASIYTLSDQRSAKLENDIRDEGDFVLFDVAVSSQDGVGDILLDLAQSASRQNSDRLANALIDNMRPTMPLLKNPKRRGALLVLLSPDVPAVLVELGYMSNGADEANLTSARWRRSAAVSIADGVDDYFEGTGVEAQLAGGVDDRG